MPLVTLNEILPQARLIKQVIPAFNVANMETLYAVVRAAEIENSPIIVQVYHRLFNDERAALIGAMTKVLAKKSSLPIVLHLDHGSSIEHIRKAIENGYTSVMIDCSARPFQENIEMTAEVVLFAHKHGVSVEGEIGHVPFGDGKIELSTAEEAKEFVKKTAVDALAISIGTAHGFYKYEPKLDLKRAMEIGKAISIPLVLHGGTGVPMEQLKESIKYGIAKINIATELQHLFVQSIRDEIKKNGDNFLPIDLYFKPVEEKLIEYTRNKIHALRK